MGWETEGGLANSIQAGYQSESRGESGWVYRRCCRGGRQWESLFTMTAPSGAIPGGSRG